jgi:hypothetical protein
MRVTLVAIAMSLLSVVVAGQRQPAPASESGQPAPATQAAPPAQAAPATQAQQPGGKVAAPASAYRGCVSDKPDATGTYTLTQAGSGNRFRLIGRSMRGYAGKMVEVTLADAKGLTIKGGLSPSPNIAAQAGHLDSAQAAVASQPGANAGKSDAQLPEFRVNRVRALDTSCAP